MTKIDKTSKKLVVFLDTIGRTIIGDMTAETDDTITIKNPAVVNIIPQQATGPDGKPIQRMALQLFPLFFREFLAAKEEPVHFKYNKKNITMSEGDITLDFKISIQYERLFASIGEVSTPTAPIDSNESTPTIKLFDND